MIGGAADDPWIITGWTQYDSTRPLTIVNNIAQGTAVYQRIGNEITLDTLDWFFNMRINRDVENFVGIGGFLRLMIVYDKQNSGTQPTVSDLLRDNIVTGNYGPTPSSGINIENRKRWIVLADEMIHLPGITTDGDGNYQMTFSGSQEKQLGFRRFIKIRGRKKERLSTVYLTNSADPDGFGAISTGGIWFMIFGDTVVNAGPPVTQNCPFEWYTRMRISFLDN